jgi:pyridoxamine 5'-phosphate oxidase
MTTVAELSSSVQLCMLVARSTTRRTMQPPFTPLPLLDESHVDPDPVVQFARWFEDARAADIPLFEAMTLATANASGRPSARMVLLKGFDRGGFIFFTNFNSRKGEELALNPAAALVFHWPTLNRQVRIEGRAQKLPTSESDAYFATRPRESQLSSHASAQSTPVTSRAALDRRFDELVLQFEGKPVPRPAHWGGYRVVPESIEFWQQRFSRLNDRVLYRLQPDGRWSIVRLAP